MSSIKTWGSTLPNKFGPTQTGAKEVCIYVIDQDVAEQFAESLSLGADGNDEAPPWAYGGASII